MCMHSYLEDVAIELIKRSAGKRVDIPAYKWRFAIVGHGRPRPPRCRRHIKIGGFVCGPAMPIGLAFAR